MSFKAIWRDNVDLSLVNADCLWPRTSANDIAVDYVDFKGVHQYCRTVADY